MGFRVVLSQPLVAVERAGHPVLAQQDTARES